jgi:hypothetical protein
MSSARSFTLAPMSDKAPIGLQFDGGIVQFKEAGSGRTMK